MSKDFISVGSSLDKKLQLRHTPITKKIDNFVLKIGEIFNWLWVILIAVIILNVVLRYVFKNGMIELEELQWHLYCIGWLVGLSSTYIVDSHVRVDVLYTGFSERKKAWTNSIGSLVLGIPLCLIVLFLGMGGKASIINGPVISFEITQQGSNGLYLLYLMAIYLAVFAVSMLIQFTSYFMSSSDKLLKN